MKTQTLGRGGGAVALGAASLAVFALAVEQALHQVGRWRFVPGSFPPRTVDILRSDDWYKKRLAAARDAYLANRKNGIDGDSPAHPFPGDGAYSWDTPESEEKSAFRYTEGPQDKAWMEARDRNYVFRLEQEGRLDKDEPKLRTEVPSLYAEVMAQRQQTLAKQQARLAEEKIAQEAQARQAEQALVARAAALQREQEEKDKVQKAAEQQAKAAAEAKAKQEADAARAKQQAEEAAAAKRREQEAAQAAALQREQEEKDKAQKEIAKDKDLLVARKQLSKGGKQWKNEALKTFRKILEKQPNHFEAWSQVVALLTETNTLEGMREALKMIMSFEPSVLKSDKQNTTIYIAAVNQLAVPLLASGNIEMMRDALEMYALAVSCFPDEASLTQGRQQIINKLAARAQFLQDFGTLRSDDTGEPQHSPRTDYAYLTQAFALEENISAYMGEEGEANRAFLESALDEVREKIKQLPEEGQDASQQRALRLQQEQQAWEETQRQGDTDDVASPAASTTGSSSLSRQSGSRQTSERGLASTTTTDSRPAEEKRLEKSVGVGALGDDGTISLNISIPYESLTYGKILGEGAFGIVYQGSLDGHTDVAIKELKYKQLTEVALQEFKQEAAIMAPLNHPNIVRLYGVCLKEAHYGMVMEYLPNVSLFGLLQNKAALPWSVRHTIIMDVTKGMSYLHSHNIVHCDLKSMNILLDEHLRAKISDFGLSKLRTESASMTAGPGGSSGSLPWMAPELFKRGSKNNKASDVYAYGMVLWEVTSRKIPFQDAVNAEAMKDWIKDGEKETVPDDCPTLLKDVITDCWEAAEKRPTMELALTRLQRWQRPTDAGARVSDLFASVRQVQPGRREGATAAVVPESGFAMPDFQQTVPGRR